MMPTRHVTRDWFLPITCGPHQSGRAGRLFFGFVWVLFGSAIVGHHLTCISPFHSALKAAAHLHLTCCKLSTSKLLMMLIFLQRQNQRRPNSIVPDRRCNSKSLVDPVSICGFSAANERDPQMHLHHLVCLILSHGCRRPPPS
jgi:hypothetical protein